MTELSDLFPATYEDSRNRFLDNLTLVKTFWPGAKLFKYYLEIDEELSIDWISARGLTRNEKLLIITTGEHGIEGFVGSAMLQRFIKEYLPRLNPKTTGLLFVHTIDPWGMKHMRRTNSQNVDLNRNFLFDPQAINQAFNPEYAQLESFLEPHKPINNYFWSSIKYFCWAHV